ncbi:MAG TPA: XdhC/CoxI family protein [Tepidisphaeraceae bacterium]
MLDLLNQIVSRCDRGEPLAICALVRTRGSTPQKAGAMMVVLTDGKTLGTIGGGCVEAEVRTQALRLIFAPTDRLLSFKLDHDYGWDDGLVCGGSMEVAVQVIATPDQAMNLRKVRDQLAEGISAQLPIAVRDEQNQLIHFSFAMQPAPTLVIAGAGHVGTALAAVASQMDFRVIVIDDRPDFASPTRFPNATIRIGSAETELEKLSLNEQSYVVIVTRGHRRDALALAAVVRSRAGYIGLIGSKRKIIKIFSDLREQGVSSEQLNRVHAPIGLNLGAVTPAEIAVSIAAEIIAVRRGSLDQKTVAPMRLTQSQIELT